METVPWWKTAVIYQIYPRSFMDASGDGVGDLRGIRSKLDYLSWLGVDAIWISPFYPSPMADFGYDISNYEAVDPLFGTLEDFDALLADVHGRGIKLILDFVPNHTSDQHPWFLQSRADRTSPTRDWYIWRDGKSGGPPNNWLSMFGGSAWEYDPVTDQYYYHAFLKEQPDLNWANEAVVEAMLGAMRFWLERGIDGFRVDVMWHLAKDPQFRDEPANPAWRVGDDPYARLEHLYSCDQPGVHPIVRRMRETLAAFGDKVLIGEIYLSLDHVITYYGSDGKSGAHLPFNFQLLTTPWRASELVALIEEYERLLPAGAWPNWVLGNHDRMRLATRVGPDQARVAAMLLLTLRGTPTLYYGDELGLEDVPIPPHSVQDPWEKNVPGLGLGRDPVRTPMPWSAAPQGGFSTAAPWLPLNGDYAARNVAALQDEKGGLLSLYRTLLGLRKVHPALNRGEICDVRSLGDVLIYERRDGADRFTIALNLSPVPTPALAIHGWVVLSTTMDTARATAISSIALAPNEGVIIRHVAF